MSESRVRVLVADTQATARRTVRSALAAVFEGATFAEAGTAEQAADLASRVRLDVIVIDASLPGSEGISALQRIHLAAPNVPILVVTALEEAREALQAFHAGAAGYLAKASAPHAIVEVVRILLDGGHYPEDSGSWVTPE